MKKIIAFLILLVAFYESPAQQVTLSAKRVMALDSVYVDGVWIKKTDVDKWNTGSTGALYVDTMYIRNDSLIYTKSGVTYKLFLSPGARINDSLSSTITVYSSNKVNSLIAASGGGDMLKSVYDPTGKNADAFNYNNLNNKPIKYRQLISSG